MSPASLPEDDASLEQANEVFWQALLGHIRHESASVPMEGVLDIGCHHGGLLAKLAHAFRPQRLTGIEPVRRRRERALFRLRGLAPTVSLLPPERWGEVPTGSVDLVTCHEVLHLLEDLPSLFTNIARVLPRTGSAFVVAGCHIENPVWRTWSAKLRAAGQTVFDRTPFDILRAASGTGLRGACDP